MEFERVFYKNDFAAGATLLNIYMICGFLATSNSLRQVLTQKDGGTNWGNLGHSGGYCINPSHRRPGSFLILTL